MDDRLRRSARERPLAGQTEPRPSRARWEIGARLLLLGGTVHLPAAAPALELASEVRDARPRNGRVK